MVSTGDRMVNTTHDSQPKGLYILSKGDQYKTNLLHIWRAEVQSPTWKVCKGHLEEMIFKSWGPRGRPE